MEGSFENPPIVITSSMAKTLLLLAGCIAFVCLGVSIIAQGPTTIKGYIGGYASVVFFGLGIPVAIWRLFVPAWLQLSPQGLDWFNGRTTKHFAWSEFGEFVAYRPSSRARSRHIGFMRLRPPTDHSMLRSLTRNLTGVDGSFGGGWSLDPGTIVDLLNRAKTRWERPVAPATHTTFGRR